jgi:glutaredoxin 3
MIIIVNKLTNLNMIEIYGKQNCFYCDKAKFLCETNNLEYSYMQLDTDYDRESFFDIFPNARTFPQIKIDGSPIGGYRDLENWNNNRK